ncbi:MAG: RNA 2'-phosphotransferase [Peptococcaceae bacterium]|nr:RNA 2'-phosphotransferase [Peptococcaceae bacterium]
MNKKEIEISKFLSYVLRHHPEAIGLILDNEGWAEIDALIKGARRIGKSLDFAFIQKIVAENDKKRFAISEDGIRIRAVQGHSTVAITFKEKTPPAFLYHGTATRFLKSIITEGIKPGNRHHVHLSEDRQTAISVGMRYGIPVVLKIETACMLEQGLKFFQAENGVWLVEYVSPSYFVVDSTD